MMIHRAVLVLALTLGFGMYVWMDVYLTDDETSTRHCTVDAGAWCRAPAMCWNTCPSELKTKETLLL